MADLTFSFVAIAATTSHKSVGCLYFYFAFWSGLVGTSLSVLVRMELSNPGGFFAEGQLYNSVLTLHAIVMIFFMVMPALVGGFGNWLLPLILGAPDMSLPRLNAISFWLLLPALLLSLGSFLIDGGSGTSWTMYPPLSTSGQTSISVDSLILSLHCAGVSSLLGGINFLTTIIVLRVPAMAPVVLSMFIWSIGVTMFLLILSLPVLAGALTMLIFDRHMNTSFFSPEGGGSPLVYQHLFWFFGHPEVYICVPGGSPVSLVLSKSFALLSLSSCGGAVSCSQDPGSETCQCGALGLWGCGLVTVMCLCPFPSSLGLASLTNLCTEWCCTWCGVLSGTSGLIWCSGVGVFLSSCFNTNTPALFGVPALGSALHGPGLSAFGTEGTLGSFKSFSSYCDGALVVLSVQGLSTFCVGPLIDEKGVSLGGNKGSCPVAPFPSLGGSSFEQVLSGYKPGEAIFTVVRLLPFAYCILKSSPGGLPSTPEDLDESSLEYLHKISSELLSGVFSFSFVRCPGASKTVSGLPFCNSVVLKALGLLLHYLWVSSFSKCSHSCLPGRSVSTALKLVKDSFFNSSWIIKPHTSSFFDGVDHSVLLSILSSNIQCFKVLSLFKSWLGVVCVFKSASRFTPKGLLRSAALSPVLFDIYLHGVDLLMEGIIFGSLKEGGRLGSPSLLGTSRFIEKSESLLSSLWESSPLWGEVLHQLLSFQGEVPEVPLLSPVDLGIVPVSYVRYADEFIIGVLGTHSLASDILDQVGVYLEFTLKLSLLPDKAVIRCSFAGSYFLGTSISVRPAKGGVALVSVRSPLGGSSLSWVFLRAPVSSLLKSQASQGLCYFHPVLKSYLPRGIGYLFVFSHRDILLFYNWKIFGILSYYVFVDNYGSLGSLVHILKWSCARTLGQKLKLSVSKVYTKFGSDLMCPLTLTKFNSLFDTKGVTLGCSKWKSIGSYSDLKTALKLSFSGGRVSPSLSKGFPGRSFPEGVETVFINKFSTTFNKIHNC